MSSEAISVPHLQEEAANEATPLEASVEMQPDSQNGATPLTPKDRLKGEKHGVEDDANGIDERGNHRGEEEEAAPTPGSIAPGPSGASGKKISAKDLVQHVKNQKRKLDEKEVEIAALQTHAKASRMRALAMAIDLVLKATSQKRCVRAFHKWLAFAQRENAALEVERVAGLAHKAGTELDAVKSQLQALQAEKAEQDTTQKKLRVLLAKAKQQMADQAKAHEQVPSGFSVDDVSRKVRAPDGTVFCMFQVRKTGPDGAAKPLTYEWRTEELVLQWLAAGRGGEQSLRERPTMEEELQERYSRASRELEAALADKQQELDAVNDRFEQFRHRAELALQKAGDSAQHNDGGAAEAALQEELARVSRDRDALNDRMEDMRVKLDAAESGLSALRLREKLLREQKEDLEHRVAEADRAMQVARAAWEQSLKRAEMDSEERLRSERGEVRAAADRAEAAEKQLAEAARREIEMRERERITQESLARAEDRIEGMRAALARAEAKANSAELSRHLATTTSTSGSLAVAAPLHLATAANNSRGSVISLSALSSPRPGGYKSTALPETAEVGDSASVVDANTGLRPRRDSADSELSASVAGTSFGGEGGSKYFVDQIGALRASHRNERAEWQKERASLREQIDIAVRRKDQAEERASGLEKRIAEQNLATERQKQLVESARTVGETPDGLLYLKNAVFRFITTDDDSERDTLLPVITLLLKFSPEEVKVLAGESKPQASTTAGVIQGLLSRWT